MTLTDKLSNVLSQDTRGKDNALDGCGVYPRHDDDLSSFEPNEEVVERAFLAARDAYARWGGAKIFTSEAYDEDRAGRGAGAVA
jgi:hypothetical protein